MPEALETVRASARRLLDLLVDGKQVVVIAPTSQLAMRAFRDVLSESADNPRDVEAYFARREIRTRCGSAEFYAERDLELRVMMRNLHYDAAWAPFGMMIDTRDLVNAAMKPRNGAWL